MLIAAEHVTKFHNDKCIVKDVSFAIEEREKIAFVGINGTGKTTLLRILAQQEPYQDGKIIYKKGLRISYLPQDPQFQKEETVMEYMVRSIRKDHLTEDFELRSILKRLGIYDHEARISTLSGGQQKRTALAAALLQPCDLLILDEPTNHLDNDMIDWLEAYLIRFSHAVLMVTHDRYFLDRITGRILEIDNGKLYSYEGNYTAFLTLKTQREHIEQAAERKRQSLLKRELAWVQAGVQARGTKSKERLGRFMRLQEMSGPIKQKEMKLDTLTSRLGSKIMEIKGISKGYHGNVLFCDVEYCMKKRDRIGILGPNGCGKSTLLDVLAKRQKPDSGTIVYGETVRLAYYRQGFDDMDGQMRVIDYILEDSNAISTEEGTFSASSMLERFLFDAQLQYTKIMRLSGGERRRLYLLKVLMQRPNVLLMDEPTNDLDLQTLQILEDYLDRFEGAVITVSHDRYFLDRICDQVFVFQPNHTLRQYIGGYSMYLSYKEPLAPKEVRDKKKRDQPLKMTSQEKRDLETIDRDMEKLQEEMDVIDSRMETVQSDYEEVMRLSRQREEKQTALEAMMEYWMYLHEKQQQIEELKK